MLSFLLNSRFFFFLYFDKEKEREKHIQNDLPDVFSIPKIFIHSKNILKCTIYIRVPVTGFAFCIVTTFSLAPPWT